VDTFRLGSIAVGVFAFVFFAGLIYWVYTELIDRATDEPGPQTLAENRQTPLPSEGRPPQGMRNEQRVRDYNEYLLGVELNSNQSLEFFKTTDTRKNLEADLWHPSIGGKPYIVEFQGEHHQCPKCKSYGVGLDAETRRPVHMPCVCALSPSARKKLDRRQFLDAFKRQVAFDNDFPLCVIYWEDRFDLPTAFRREYRRECPYLLPFIREAPMSL